MWDVVVVGARCAGAATAIHFARGNRSVLLLDQGRIDTDTLSTHVLVTTAVAQLKDLGLLDEVQATGAPPVHGSMFEWDGGTQTMRLPGACEYMLCVRRRSLDPILARAAARAGARLREKMRVERLLWDGQRVVGVRTRSSDGTVTDEYARLVVGADGRHSLVARQAQAQEYNVVESATGAFYAYFDGVRPATDAGDVLQCIFKNRYGVLTCPCNDNLHVILLIVGREEFDVINKRGIQGYEQTLKTIPSLAGRLDAAGLKSALYRANPRELRGYFRKPYGPGWALVGDASYCAHPAAANGISDALRSAELAHRFVEQGWSEGKPSETYLVNYELTRDLENIEPFYASHRLSSFNPAIGR